MGGTKPSLFAELSIARDNVARLERAVAEADCRTVGHSWQHIGGTNCGCTWFENGERCDGSCSVPVHECRRCKDCDYGENAEADKIRADCEGERA